MVFYRKHLKQDKTSLIYETDDPSLSRVPRVTSRIQYRCQYFPKIICSIFFISHIMMAFQAYNKHFPSQVAPWSRKRRSGGRSPTPMRGGACRALTLASPICGHCCRTMKARNCPKPQFFNRRPIISTHLSKKRPVFCRKIVN